MVTGSGPHLSYFAVHDSVVGFGPDIFTVFAFPPTQRRRLRTSNLMERISKEIKRRTRVATLFPNEASLLRLVSAVLMEISEEWETEKTYLGMKNLTLPEQD